MLADYPYGNCPRCGRKRVYVERSEVRLLGIDGVKVCAVQIDDEALPKTNNSWVECEAELSLEERLSAFIGSGETERLIRRWRVRPGLYGVCLQFEWMTREAEGKTIEQALMTVFDEIDLCMEETARHVEVPPWRTDLTRGRRGVQRRLKSG